jgi:hypothetical protein
MIGNMPERKRKPKSRTVKAPPKILWGARFEIKCLNCGKKIASTDILCKYCKKKISKGIR